HVTASALLAFARGHAELAMLETGLGGRLDSTTAARADVVAITPVAMDHEEYLGHTIEDIVAEKAAIIRAGVPAVIAPQQGHALDVIMERCEEVGVTPVRVFGLNGAIERDSLHARYPDASRRCIARFREATP